MISAEMLESVIFSQRMWDKLCWGDGVDNIYDICVRKVLMLTMFAKRNAYGIINENIRGPVRVMYGI